MEYGMLYGVLIHPKKKKKSQLERMGDLIEDEDIQTQLGQTKLEME
jgi:hypothetical protein